MTCSGTPVAANSTRALALAMAPSSVDQELASTYAGVITHRT
ncbi:hypothetical protein [Streptomyces sp. A1-5]|nr:hypothetical protein [Streptomyces sp. A1-5]